MGIGSPKENDLYVDGKKVGSFSSTADLHHRAVSEHDLESAHIVARDAVLHRAHAAGVRADVAADARGLFAGIGRYLYHKMSK